MKSKIKFDLDGDNQPIIVAEIQDSEDLRDKVAKRFAEKVNYSSWCKINFSYTYDDKGKAIEKLITFDPIEGSIVELEKLSKNVIEQLEFEKNFGLKRILDLKLTRKKKKMNKRFTQQPETHTPCFTTWCTRYVV